MLSQRPHEVRHDALRQNSRHSRTAGISLRRDPRSPQPPALIWPRRSVPIGGVEFFPVGIADTGDSRGPERTGKRYKGRRAALGTGASGLWSGGRGGRSLVHLATHKPLLPGQIPRTQHVGGVLVVHGPRAGGPQLVAGPQSQHARGGAGQQPAGVDLMAQVRRLRRQHLPHSVDHPHPDHPSERRLAVGEVYQASEAVAHRGPRHALLERVQHGIYRRVFQEGMPLGAVGPSTGDEDPKAPPQVPHLWLLVQHAVQGAPRRLGSHVHVRPLQ
mmetsp:Transcript_25005/g.57099  ORF Transcript_25005/g.57099 Transcript_25005/m.57099 type:complete len:273 (-) Transcript_25005:82-900(-)